MPAVMRVLPRNNDAVNEEWISDKSRHVADGLRTQRLDQPYIRKDGRLVPASWDEALALVAAKLTGTDAALVGAIAGDLAGAEEMFALKDLMGRLGGANLDCRQDGARLDPALGRASYIFNSGIEAIEAADAIMLIGTNPRIEAAVLNTRIRKRWRQGGLLVGVVGEAADLGYSYSHLGTGPESLAQFVEHAPAKKERPMFIVGSGAYARPDGAAVLAMVAKAAASLGVVKDGWNGFNILHTAAARVGGLDLGFVPGKAGRDAAGMLKGDMQVVYLLGADEVVVPAGAFVIYQGTHGDRGAHRADVILPGAAYTEKSATYVNTEGRAQMTAKAAFPPGDAKEDWTILRALSDRCGKTLPYDTLSALRAAMYRSVPGLANIGGRSPAAVEGVAALAAGSGTTTREPFRSPITDFYQTNPIARASAIMAEMSALKMASGAASGAIRQAAE
jgi:NADH-quinone oxidoreductase subunit G